MKSVVIVLAVGMFATGTAQSQTQSTTNPASTTATASRPLVRPPATSAAPEAASPNRRQELYDQYHGFVKKPGPLAPATPAPTEREASRPASQSVPLEPVSRIERPLSSDMNASGVRIGIRGGATLPVYLETVTGTEPVVSFVGGFVVQFGRGTVSFQPELNYARYAVKSAEPFDNVFISVATDRFEVPLLLKIASGSVNSSRFFVNVGPYGAYASSSSVNGQKLSLDGAGGRLSYGAAAGVGTALKVGMGHVTLELRGLYELGTTDNGINTDSKTILSQATVGYMFPLGGR